MCEGAGTLRQLLNWPKLPRSRWGRNTSIFYFPGQLRGETGMPILQKQGVVGMDLVKLCDLRTSGGLIAGR